MVNSYVVITGASKGIGRATALYLDKKGFHVFAGVRNPEDGEALCQGASERLTPVILDITKQDQITQAAKQIEQCVGSSGLAGIVNNAGMVAAAPLEFLPIDEFRYQLEVNLVGQLAVTQAVLPLIRLGKGRIINISSIGGRIAGGMIGAYHASKFALEALSDTLRVELKPWGIEVICIEPGAIATPIWETSVATLNRIISSTAAKMYAPQIAQTRANAASAYKQGLPPEKVAEIIERALITKRPKTRYLVGRDAMIAGHLIARLPDRLRDRLMSQR
ncbi:MAG TPA: SDR family oxidoreductase [Aggregatilineaceae bacterium]|nr:SDR family oxidoreductase [Aggregatilineaceae bacterium]